jgi:hypothetical protein
VGVGRGDGEAEEALVLRLEGARARVGRLRGGRRRALAAAVLRRGAGAP